MFKRKQQQSSPARHRLTDAAASKIASGINRLQNGFASFMNKSTNHFSARTWKLLIVVFALAWGAFSFHFIAMAFTSQQSMHKSGKQLFIARPIHSDSLALMEQIYEQQIKLIK